jgi:exosortase
LFAAGAAAALLVIYEPTVASALLSREAGTDPLRVAALAPLAAGWLLWHRRRELKEVVGTPWWPGLLGVAAGAAVWVLGELAGLNALRQLAVVAMLSALALALLGGASARTLAVPLLFLLFCVNAFFPLVGPLMRLDAWAGVVALQWTGIPARLEDLTVVTPFGRWQIIEACGGLDYVLIFTMSGLLFGSIAFRSPLRRALFVGASIAAAILANALRTWGVVFAVHARGGVDLDHSLIGWTAFAVVFALLFAFGSLFQQPVPETRGVPGGAGSRSNLRGVAALALAALAIAGAAPVGVAALEHAPSVAASFNGCRIVEQTRIERDGGPVERTRTQCIGPAGVERAPLIAKARFQELAPDAVMSTGTRRMDAREGRAFDAATLTALGSAREVRMTYWYQVGDFVTGSRVAMKWHFALERLAGRMPNLTVVTEVQGTEAAYGT